MASAPSHTRVIPCGVDLRAFTPGDRGRTAPGPAARSGWMMTPTLLFVGRLDPIKGIDLLLESVALLRTPARLLVVGGDPAGDPEVERLRARAAALGIADRVRFPGAVPQGDLPTVLPTRWTRWSSRRATRASAWSAVEALACGAAGGRLGGGRAAQRRARWREWAAGPLAQRGGLRRADRRAAGRPSAE